jgi:uncharacterized protein (DUF849 family)
MEGDQRRKVAMLSRWTGPDSATVNLCEDEAVDTMRALMGSGIALEAGIWTVEDAELLLRIGLADRMDRILIELFDVPPSDVEGAADQIHAVLDRADVLAPRLQHGEGDNAWTALEDAVRRGFDTRVGLEDVLVLPNGSHAAGNAALVTAARELGAG